MVGMATALGSTVFVRVTSSIAKGVTMAVAVAAVQLMILRADLFENLKAIGARVISGTSWMLSSHTIARS